MTGHLPTRPILSTGPLLTCLLTTLLLSFLAFGSVMPGEFVVDDRLWAEADPADKGKTSALQAIGSWTFRPLHTSFILTAHALLEQNVAAWHALSIVLHATNGFLLFLLLRALLPTHVSACT